MIRMITSLTLTLSLLLSVSIADVLPQVDKTKYNSLEEYKAATVNNNEDATEKSATSLTNIKSGSHSTSIQNNIVNPVININSGSDVVISSEKANDPSVITSAEHAQKMAAIEQKNNAHGGSSIHDWTEEDFINATPGQLGADLAKGNQYDPSNQGDRAADHTFEVCSDYWASEGAWAVYDYYYGAYITGYNYFDYSYACSSVTLNLAPGMYAVVTWDSYGDGGQTVYVDGEMVGINYADFTVFDVELSDPAPTCTDHTVYVGGSSYPSEVSWELEGYTGGEGTYTVCLEDGDHIFNMYDAWGDGWDFGSAVIYDADGTVVGSGTCDYYYCGSAGSFSFTTGGPPPVPGCTDDTAENYDAGADLDDGSCTWNGGCSSPSYTACADGTECVPTSYFCDGSSEYGNAGWGADCSDGSDEGAGCCDQDNAAYGDCSALEDCAGTFMGTATAYSLSVGGGSWDSEISWALSSGDSGAAGSFDLCLEDGDYTLTMCDAYGDGWNGATFSLLNSDGEGFETFGPDSGDPCEDIGFSLPGVAPDVAGCMDPNAPQYNPEAVIDDGSCMYPGMSLGYLYGSYYDNAYIDCTMLWYSWDNDLDGISDSAQNDICDNDAVYGPDFSCLNDCDGGACENCAGECNGADDSTECWDGSNECDPNDCPAQCTDSILTLTMNDSYGDGWNGNEFCINADCATLVSGSTGSQDFCVDLNGTNDITCGGGSYMSEVSWTLTGDGVDLAGGAPYAGCVGSCPVYGCTDETADNHNADADVDDGSCLYNGCPLGYLADCSGDGDCASESWASDAYCDGSDQPYGWDGTCYGCDGGACESDCTGACEGTAVVDDCGDCDGGNAGQDDCGVCYGDGCSCTGTGDVNDDGDLNVADIVILVGAILGDADMTCANVADANGDGSLNVLDAIVVVSLILGKTEAADADYAKVIITHEGARFESNGFVGFELVLQHGADFDYTLPEAAIVKAANADGTHMVVINDNNNILFNSTDEFEIVDVIAGSASGKSIAVQIIDATQFGLSNAYPNPFNPSTTLNLTVPEAGYVSVQVYNVMGQVVATLANGQMEANAYSLNWNAGSNASGLYFIKAECAGNVEVQKVMLMK